MRFVAVGVAKSHDKRGTESATVNTSGTSHALSAWQISEPNIRNIELLPMCAYYPVGEAIDAFVGDHVKLPVLSDQSMLGHRCMTAYIKCSLAKICMTVPGSCIAMADLQCYVQRTRIGL